VTGDGDLVAEVRGRPPAHRAYAPVGGQQGREGEKVRRSGIRK